MTGDLMDDSMGSNSQLIELKVPEIHCAGCVRSIEMAVAGLEGVTEVRGDAARKAVAVRYRPTSVDPDKIAGAIKQRGFSVLGSPGQETVTAAGHVSGGANPAWYLAIAIALAAALALGGYLLGFRGFIYGVALPEAFGSLNIIAVAAIAGAAAFFSPCVFPLLPAYASYYLMQTPGTRVTLRRSLYMGIFAALGIIVVNLVLGAAIALVAEAAPFQPDPRQDSPAILAVRFAAGLVIALMGVRGLLGHTAAIRLPSFLAKATAGGREGGAKGFLLYGLTYNAAGIGCTGPILLGLMLYALVTGQALTAFFTFAITMGALMVMVTVLVGLARTTIIGRLRGATHAIQRMGAVMLTAVGIYTMLILSFGRGRELFVRIFLPFLN